MDYEKTAWKNGDVVTSAKLNNIEDGIGNLYYDVTEMSTEVNRLNDEVEDLINKPITDEKLKWTTSTNSNIFYPLQSTSISATSTANTLNSVSFYQYYNTAGGYRRLTLGNSGSYTSSGGAYGKIRLYGTGTTYYGDINPGTIGANSLTANRTWTLPNATGTIALTSDIIDTKNTAGATNSDSKLYLIGATSQSTSPHTYSNSNLFFNNGLNSETSIVSDWQSSISQNSHNILLEVNGDNDYYISIDYSNGITIDGVITPTEDSHAANKKYVDDNCGEVLIVRW